MMGDSVCRQRRRVLTNRPTYWPAVGGHLPATMPSHCGSIAYVRYTLDDLDAFHEGIKGLHSARFAYAADEHVAYDKDGTDRFACAGISFENLEASLDNVKGLSKHSRKGPTVLRDIQVAAFCSTVTSLQGFTCGRH